MLGDFDIQSVAQEILTAEDLVETETIRSTTRAYDGKGSSVVVNGNITAGAVVKGTYDLLVQGWVVGEEGRPCQIEAEGDVVIEGDVRNARIKGQSIRIGGEARRCQLNSQRGVEIGGGYEWRKNCGRRF